jgi:hypothetical protein
MSWTTYLGIGIAIILFSCSQDSVLEIEEPLFLQKLAESPFLYEFDNIPPTSEQELYIYPTWEDGDPTQSLFTFYVKYVIDNANCEAGTFGDSPYIVDLNTESIISHDENQVVLSVIGFYGTVPTTYIWTLTSYQESTNVFKLSFEIHAEDDNGIMIPNSDWIIPFTRTIKNINSLEICN